MYKIGKKRYRKDKKLYEEEIKILNLFYIYRYSIRKIKPNKLKVFYTLRKYPNGEYMDEPILTNNHISEKEFLRVYEGMFYTLPINILPNFKVSKYLEKEKIQREKERIEIKKEHEKNGKKIPAQIEMRTKHI